MTSPLIMLVVDKDGQGHLLHFPVSHHKPWLAAMSEGMALVSAALGADGAREVEIHEGHFRYPRKRFPLGHSLVDVDEFTNYERPEGTHTDASPQH